MSAEADLVPAEADLVPAEADQGSAKERLVPAEADLAPAEADQGFAEERLVSAEADLVPAEAEQGSAEEQLVPAQMQLVSAEADLVPAEVDQGSAEEQLVPAQMQLMSAEADLVPAEADLVSTTARPADTARKRTPSAVTEDPGPVLPSEQEAGATASCAEATRPVESVEATSPQSCAGMPAAVGEGPREPRDATPSPPPERRGAAGWSSWEDQLSRRNRDIFDYKEFRELSPEARLGLVRNHGLCKLCLGRCDPGGKGLHKECPANRYELRRTCAELCVNIEDI